ncbi:hypothetical protein FHX10_006733 [Rhizobium sp. BK591]|uniref:potassium channel family protein n=1 Tax=Rhizobium sp. BK591 TaxID=2586985 RepID=UPI0013AFC76F|nr:potassium channel family protein [Rhizobium sp. BK591]MBB3747177.1 hypothetical protein [Rhizobium sp. BK591]
MNDARAEDDRSLRPHAVPNMQTPIGRLIDRLGYGALSLVASGALTLSTTYFAIAPKGQGIETNDVGDALYFSIVTFTSLGYGDLQPHGVGRAVASVLVLVGISVTALLIGRVASERQSSLLLLLHSSDVQRRLSSFTQQLHDAADEISQAGPMRARKLKSTGELLQAVSSYLSFNAFQAGILSFGNFTALTMLYDALNETFEACMAAFKDGENAETMNRALACGRTIERLINLMSRLHHQSEREASSWKKIRGTRRGRSQVAAGEKAQKLRSEMFGALQSSMEWRDKAFHALQVERVFKAMPSGNQWPTGIHKEVAAALKISPSTATKCITELKNNGRLPKY